MVCFLKTKLLLKHLLSKLNSIIPELADLQCWVFSVRPVTTLFRVHLKGAIHTLSFSLINYETSVSESFEHHGIRLIDCDGYQAHVNDSKFTELVPLFYLIPVTMGKKLHQTFAKNGKEDFVQTISLGVQSTPKGRDWTQCHWNKIKPWGELMAM